MSTYLPIFLLGYGICALITSAVLGFLNPYDDPSYPPAPFAIAWPFLLVGGLFIWVSRLGRALRRAPLKEKP